MPIDILRTVDLLKDALLRKLGDEVNLVFKYGSYLDGSVHKYSDLDISYVPVHESTWDSITVLVDDVMIDLYPIHWSQLEQMANFDNISCTVLLKNHLVYQSSDEVAQRFHALPGRLRQLQLPEARPEMLKKAQAIFKKTGYQFYLLHRQAANGHTLSCLHHAQNILKSVMHCLMVCNQACIDTRKLDQVLALPKLPLNFAETVDKITDATDPGELLAGCETLLHTTQDLLLSEQQEVQRSDTFFPVVFDAAYPEFKGELQHLLLACEREDMFNLNVIPLYHELMFHMAWAFSGVEYSDFNSLAEYEQDLAEFGFPDLLPYRIARDFEGLHEQTRVFDQSLREYLTARSVLLNEIDSVDELQMYLNNRFP